MQAARELGYVPNVYGQRLRSGQSKTVGLVTYRLASFTARFHGPFALEILYEVASKGYDLSVVDMALHPQEDMARVLFQKGVVGAVLLGGRYPAEALEAMQGSALPVIQLDNYAEGYPGLACVASENFRGMYGMTRHLIDLGHRRLACAGVPSRLSCFGERYQGFRKALADAGLEEAGLSVTRGQDHAARLLSITPRPTAIAGLSDSYAEDALRAAREAGISVPGDLSVTGFDDVDQAFVSGAALTTVRADLREMARTAIEFLTNPGHRAGRQTRFRVRTELIRRGSTGPPPTGA